MAKPLPLTESTATDPALEFIWSQFKVWDITATIQKQKIFNWQLRVLILVILGSFTALLSDSLIEWGLPSLARVSIIIATLTVALCSFANSQILTQDGETSWVRARAVAEMFKSEAYLYQLKAAPYDSETPEVSLFDRSKSLINTVKDLTPELVPDDVLTDKPVPIHMTFEYYLEERVKNQLTYFQQKAKHYNRLIKKMKNLGLFLGFIGAIMGTISAHGLDQLTIWIAFLNSTTASMTSFHASRKYLQLLTSYRNTAHQLTRLLHGIQRIPAYDLDAQRAFVISCEKVLSAESKTWLDEFSE